MSNDNLRIKDFSQECANLIYEIIHVTPVIFITYCENGRG